MKSRWQLTIGGVRSGGRQLSETPHRVSTTAQNIYLTTAITVAIRYQEDWIILEKLLASFSPWRQVSGNRCLRSFVFTFLVGKQRLFGKVVFALFQRVGGELVGFFTVLLSHSQEGLYQ